MTKETEREEQKLQAVTAQSEQQSNDYEKKVSRGVAGTKKVWGGANTEKIKDPFFLYCVSMGENKMYYAHHTW